MTRMLGPAHSREFMRMLDEQLREEVSVVKRTGYLHTLELTSSVPSLGAIERQVRLDTGLTQGDRSLLLSTVARKLSGSSAPVVGSRLRRSARS